jgi:ABC-type transporter Mla MlaB component
MFRITPTDGDGERTLRLEGRLVALWVGELLSTCREAASAERCLVLDLSGVTFVDAAGLACLRDLRERGAVLRGCSAFINELLKV